MTKTEGAKMEVESTKVSTLPNGKKLIDVTMRRTNGTPAQSQITPPTKLVVPRFDESDSDSSSDSDGGQMMKSRPDHGFPASKSHTSMDDDEDNNVGSPEGMLGEAGQTFNGEFKWDAVNDIQQLTNQNLQMKAQVVDYKKQIQDLQIQLEALEPIPGLNPSSVQELLLQGKDGTALTEHDIRDVKIVHQAKKIRSLKRTIQRDQHVANDAVKNLQRVQKENEQLVKEVDQLKMKISRIQAHAQQQKLLQAAGSTLGVTADDLAAAGNGDQTPSVTNSTGINPNDKKKFEDLKIKYEKLQQELKKTQRALVREVGEEVSLEAILDNEASGKRGRAQQIVMLKARVKKLEKDLADKQEPRTRENSNSQSPSRTHQQTFDVDQRAHQEIGNQQLQRQKLLDKLQEEKDELIKNLTKISKQQEALKSRTQILEKEKQDFKTKIQVFHDKSKNDDALIEALQKQLSIIQGKSQANDTKLIRVRTAESAQKNEQLQTNAVEMERMRYLIQDQKRQLVNQEKTIESYKHELEKTLELNSKVYSEGRTTNITTNGGGANPDYRILAVEKERLSELVKVQQHQIEELQKQMKQNGGNYSVADSRLPRFGFAPAPVLAPALAPQHQHRPPMPTCSSTLNSSSNHEEMETLRATFRKSIHAKDEEIQKLHQQIENYKNTQSKNKKNKNSHEDEQDDDYVDNLEQENHFLRQEFDKLKKKYEQLVVKQHTK